MATLCSWSGFREYGWLVRFVMVVQSDYSQARVHPTENVVKHCFKGELAMPSQFIPRLIFWIDGMGWQQDRHNRFIFQPFDTIGSISHLSPLQFRSHSTNGTTPIGCCWYLCDAFSYILFWQAEWRGLPPMSPGTVWQNKCVRQASQPQSNH